MMARELKLITGLVELDRTSLRERALEMLRKAVTAREIEPGSRLVETELSAAMGISRGTLREALRQLEYEGLIEVGERGRLTVRTLTDAELADMFTVRAALEGLAAATISTRPDRDLLLAELQTALDALRSRGRLHRRHGRRGPGLPPTAVRSDRQRHPGPGLGNTHRPDPGGDPVRRPGSGVGQHVRRPPSASARRHRAAVTRAPPGARSTRTCARPPARCWPTGA